MLCNDVFAEECSNKGYFCRCLWCSYYKGMRECPLTGVDTCPMHGCPKYPLVKPSMEAEDNDE